MQSLILRMPGILWISEKMKRIKPNHHSIHLLKEIIYFISLGFSMAVISLVMDFLIGQCLRARIMIYESLQWTIGLQYLSWVSFATILLLGAAIFVHFIGPKSIGSGIPEIKSVIQGFPNDAYFTFSTLLSKCVGLTMSTGSGLPVGREGPFIHIACILALRLNRLFKFVPLSEETDKRKSELLIAACAVGVACCFSAPIGGVLFSIEVTSTYFAVKNYWIGFFCAISGALIFKLLDIWFYGEEIVSVFYKSRFAYNFLLCPQEIILFIAIGVICGFVGALFIYIYSKITKFLKSQKVISKFIIKNWWLYTIIITVIVSSITYPKGVGKYFLTELTQQQIIKNMFYNLTFSQGSIHTRDVKDFNSTAVILNDFIILSSFIFLQFIGTILVLTLPIPIGVFLPVFVLGAAIGRVFGDFINFMLPEVIAKQYPNSQMLSGIYSMIGAAALSGSVTRTLSTSVIVFELTGQMTHLLPTMIAVLVSNGIAHCFIPSLYDIMILTKGLPFLHDIVESDEKIRGKLAEDIMIKNITYIQTKFTLKDITNLLEDSSHNEFPIVENDNNQLFLGSISRSILNGYILRDKIEKEIGFKIKTNVDSILDQIESGKTPFKKPDKPLDWLAILKYSPNSSSIQIAAQTQLVKVHEIFLVLNLNTLYVTFKGRLLGLINYSDLIKHINI